MKKPSAGASKSPPAAIAANVAIGLNAVLAAVENEHPLVLCVKSGGALGLPYGPFNPERHRTFEIGMREWVELQTNVSLGFIEQLYTFGDEGREAPAAALAGGGENDRVISVGYLALAPAPAEVHARGAGWRNWYAFFPWEDWRNGEPKILRSRIIPALNKWAKRGGKKTANERLTRLRLFFGVDQASWQEERCLDRYELLYEAGLVVEAWRDREAAKLDPPDGARPEKNETGAPMISDHRRILATAIGRLRGKLKYRPIIFEMIAEEFTLLQLQRTVEAISGFEFHKQNFRRSVEKSGFVEPTGETTQQAGRQAGGRPAALFRVDREGLADRAATGLTIPRMRAG